jgi:4-hydroxythreonine-4-phosphate dehydrogenase
MKLLGITIGDVNGIGVEVILKALAYGHWSPETEFVLLGSEALVRKQAEAMGIPILRRLRFHDVGEAVWNPGRLRVDASRLAVAAIEEGVKQALIGQLDGLVTAPVNKLGFQRAGVDVPGHTELLAALTDTSRYGMMLVGGGLRVMLATRHLPLKDVSEAITKEVVREAVELAYEGLAWLGVNQRSIGVCGLNPHAGDGGALGMEEKKILNPVLRALIKKGMPVSMALPADTLFHQALRGEYEAVVAMYHDQGLAPLKMVGFDEGINLTLGLPIVRTSPDHGTAFKLAGEGVASAKSMREAIRLAVRLADRKNPWV